MGQNHKKYRFSRLHCHSHHWFHVTGPMARRLPGSVGLGQESSPKSPLASSSGILRRFLDFFSSPSCGEEHLCRLPFWAPGTPAFVHRQLLPRCSPMGKQKALQISPKPLNLELAMTGRVVELIYHGDFLPQKKIIHFTIWEKVSATTFFRSSNRSPWIYPHAEAVRLSMAEPRGPPRFPDQGTQVSRGLTKWLVTSQQCVP